MIRTAALICGALMAMPTAADTPQRVVALGGAVTEIVAALGAADRLVGRDTTSTWPPEITTLPDVGYVRALSAEGVLSLAPDLILADAGAGPVETVDLLRNAGVPFVTMPGEPSATGVVDRIRSVGAALDRQPEAEALARAFGAEMDALRARTGTVDSPRRVLFVLAIQNGRVMVGGKGSSAAEIISLAGGINAVDDIAGYKPVTDEALLHAAPDVILMMDREGDLAVTARDVQAHPALSLTPAARTGAIIRMDGMLLLGFGPRTAKAAQALFDALYEAG